MIHLIINRTDISPHPPEHPFIIIRTHVGRSAVSISLRNRLSAGTPTLLAKHGHRRRAETGGGGGAGEAQFPFGS